MLEGLDETWLPTLFPTAFASVAHMAPCTCIYEDHYSPPRAAVIHLGLLTLHSIMAVLLAMEHIRDSSNDNVGYGGSPSPLQGNCAPGSADASVKTNTGWHCSLHACFEPLPGFHFSHSPLCSLNSLSSVWIDQRGGLICHFQAPSANLSDDQSFSSPPALPVSPFCPGPLRQVPVDMPRLRERMRSRRGLSRGLRRPPPTLGTVSSSADEDHGHTLGPRGERGRGRGHTRGVVDVSVDVALPSPSLAQVPIRSSPPPCLS